MRIFSGIRASGAKTLGNYSGGFRQYAATQEQGDAFFCIVDLHSITTPFEPRELQEATLDLAALLFATGLDPDRSTVFVQSHVTAHPAQLTLHMQSRDVTTDRRLGRSGHVDQIGHGGDRPRLDGSQNDPVALGFVQRRSPWPFAPINSNQCQS